MCLLLFLALGIAVPWANAHANRYVCPPCAAPCDSKVFDRPGTCPSCGMTLITEEEAKAAAANAAPAGKVAILIFDGVEIIDFTGPYEVFGAANFDVYTVARTKEPVTTAMGMTVIPKYSFDDLPLPDVLVVPGGGVKATQNDAATLKWITEETARIQHTMSVCNGAFILASAGLLDGLTATTTNGNIPRMRDQFPNIKVVDNQRFVDNGKIITAAGLSAGIDGALHVVELLRGKGYAEQIALGEEYEWKPSAPFVRAALADHLIPEVDPGPDFGKWEIVSTEGGTDRWETVARCTSKKTPGEIMDFIERAYSIDAKWIKVSGGTDGSSRWSFAGRDGKPWSGIVTIQESSPGSHQYTVKVRISMVG